MILRTIRDVDIMLLYISAMDVYINVTVKQLVIITVLQLIYNQNIIKCLKLNFKHFSYKLNLLLILYISLINSKCRSSFDK